MPIYVWKARTRQGTLKKGEIEAINDQAVMAQLRSQMLMPVTVAAGFAYFALDPSEAADWAGGLLALIPLEYVRAIVLSILSDTYRQYRTPVQAVRFFLLSLAILTAIALAISVYVLKGDWWAWIAKPEVHRALAAALALIAVDGVIGVYFFRGDPKRLAARLEAVADDARDWVQLAGFQLPIVLALLYGALLLLREARHVLPWLPGVNRLITSARPTTADTG